MSHPGQTHFIIPAISLWKREIVRFIRQRNRIVSALATPVVIWLLIGSGLGPTFQLNADADSMSYIEYFFPGTLVLIMLFTAIFSTITVIEDRREGFLQSVLVAPVSPGSIVLGKLLGGATLATLQGAIFLLLAPTIGMALPLGKLPMLIVTFFIVGLAMTGLGFLVAWPMDSTAGFHAIMNIFLMPLWMLSGALFPIPTTGWVYWVGLLNPVSYCVSAVRYCLYADATGVSGEPGFAMAFIVSTGFALVLYLIAYRMVQSRRKVIG